MAGNPQLKWGPDLELGVPAMDAQHQRLIAAMQAIQELDAQRADGAVIGRHLVDLVELTRAHFADEESHMAAIGYADLRRHALIHHDLLQKLGEYHGAFTRGNGRLPDGFLRFLVYWLSSHIQGIDRKYATARQPAPARS